MLYTDDKKYLVYAMFISHPPLLIRSALDSDMMRHQVQSVVVSSRHRNAGTNTNFTVSLPQTGASGLALGSVSLASFAFTNMLSNVPEPYNRFWYYTNLGVDIASFTVPPAHYTFETLLAAMIENAPQNLAFTVSQGPGDTILIECNGAGNRPLSVSEAKTASQRSDGECSLNELLGIAHTADGVLVQGASLLEGVQYSAVHIPNLTGQKYILLCCHETSPGRGYVASITAPISLVCCIPIKCSYGESGVYEPPESGVATTILDHTASPRMLTFTLLNEFGVELVMPSQAEVLVNLTFIYQGDN